MIKRLLKKGSEQIVRGYEYYRVAIQQEMEDRLRERRHCAYTQRSSSTESHGHYPQPPYYQQHYSLSSPSPSPSPSSHMAPPPVGGGQHPLHSDLPPPPQIQLAPGGSGGTIPHHLFSPTNTTHPGPSNPQHHSPGPHLPQQHHTPSATTTHHSLGNGHHHAQHFNLLHNRSTSEDEPVPNTMIERKNHTGDEGGLEFRGLNSSPPITASSNGLRRVESEGSSSSLATARGSNAQSKTYSKGFSIHSVSAGQVGLPRQGSSNFLELFDTAQNVQETFV